MIQQVFYFDIQDSINPVTWTIYCLLFAEALDSGNDRIYKINVDEMDEFISDASRANFDKEIRVHPRSRCFPGDPGKAFLEMQARPSFPTYEEAISEFREWLKENGLPEGETEVLVKIWW